VQVTNVDTKTTGSGVLIRRNGAHAYVLAAAHVVGKGKKLEVRLRLSPKMKAKVYGAELLASSDESDSAVLRLATDDDLRAPLPLRPTAVRPKRARPVAAGAGWAAGDEPTIREETVPRKAHVRRSEDRAAVWCWETKRKQELGRSGGPLFDGEGRVIGTAS